MLFVGKVFFFGGVSFSRFTVVKCGPSEGLSLMNTHSSKNAFFKASSNWDLIYKHFDPLCGLSLLRYHQGLVRFIAASFHKVLSETATTLAVFPRECTCSMVTTKACCPCHLVRVISTLAVEWRNLPGDGCRSFHVVQIRTLVSPRGG